MKSLSFCMFLHVATSFQAVSLSHSYSSSESQQQKKIMVQIFFLKLMVNIFNPGSLSGRLKLQNLWGATDQTDEQKLA